MELGFNFAAVLGKKKPLVWLAPSPHVSCTLHRLPVFDANIARLVRVQLIDHDCNGTVVWVSCVEAVWRMRPLHLSGAWRQPKLCSDVFKPTAPVLKITRWEIYNDESLCCHSATARYVPSFSLLYCDISGHCMPLRGDCRYAIHRRQRLFSTSG